MEYCKYHPLTSASWYCPHCDTYLCDSCTEEATYNDQRRCFNCGNDLESLGSAFTAEPFWHHLKEMFHYPLKGHSSALVLIIGVALINGLLIFIPFIGLIAVLMTTGIFLKYSFLCLEETANGNMVPPDIQDAYDGGILIIFKLIGLMLLIGIGSGFLAAVVGPGIVGLLGMLMALSIPAFLIGFALTDSVLKAALPVNIFHIITAIGMPYGILIGFLFLMFSSVDVFSYLLSSKYSTLTLILQSLISNYYSIVMFHMLGYVVFQYQGKLGFYAREQNGDAPVARSDAEKLQAHVSVAVKQGDYDKVSSLYQTYLNKYSNDGAVFERWFEFVLRTKRRDMLAQVADNYIGHKYRNGQKSELKFIYKQVVQMLPDYIPADGNVRSQLAQDFYDSGDAMTCVRLINGMHKKYAELPLLIRSYLLLAKALDDLNKPEQAVKCRQMVMQLQKKACISDSA